jgi:hypothetical protein
MRSFVQLDETGVFVVGAGFAPSLSDGDLEVEGDPNRFLRHYMVDGVLTPRPMAPEPVAIEGGWEITELPNGTRVEIHDVTGDEVLFSGTTDQDGSRVEFALPDAGVYQVNVDAPEPYVDTSTEIVVENAGSE